MAQWPQYRGPNGTGIDAAGTYPDELDPAKTQAWKVAVPYGQSSPVIAGGRLYLTASEGDRLLTLAYDPKTGRELWRRELARVHRHKIYKTNDPASPTPAAGDDGVVVFFPDRGLTAYAPDGRERWSVPLGPFKGFYGLAASPILAGDLVILVCDQTAGGFMAAYDRATGKPRWRTERPLAKVGWSTPMVHRPKDGRPQLIVLGSTRLDAYSLATGESVWWTPIGSSGAISTPLADGGRILVCTAGSTEPYVPTYDTTLEKYDRNKDRKLTEAEFRPDPDLGEHFCWLDDNRDGIATREEWDAARSLGIGEYGAIALDPGSAHGRLPASAIRWRVMKAVSYIPSPLLYQGVYYMARTGGILTALDPASGAVLKTGRITGALGQYYSSPVAADGKLYLASEEGKVSVVKAGAAWEVMNVNDLGEEIHTVPALHTGRVYIRTRGSLHCFGAAR